MSIEELSTTPVKVKKDKKMKKDKKEKKEKKAEAAEVDVPAEGDAAELEQAKREKKERKEKKKAEKAAAKAAAKAEAAEEAVESGDAPTAAPEEPEKKKKDKKDKKEKKDKKDKAAKKEKKAKAAAAAEADTEMTDAPAPEDKKRKTRDDDAPAPKSKKAKADAPSSNGSGGPSTYTEAAALSALPQSEIDEFLASKFVTISDPTNPATLPRPILSFSHLPSTPLLRKNPFAAFPAPTPIQSASWPSTLAGRDVIGVAETGSGKTMAFALPCVEALSLSRAKGGIRAVVVCPTRELAMQTHEQVTKLTSLVGLSCVCVYGGSPKPEQRESLRRADIVVATPGRLKDFINEGSCPLGGAQFVVLDEADRMLDTGFEEDIKAILGACPPKEDRQTLMFTATWPASVQALASSMMTSPVKIGISTSGANPDGELQANMRISQTVEVVDPRAKEQRLLQLLQKHQTGARKDDRILVFCLYKKEATRVEDFLTRRGMKVAGIHGDLKQEQRTRSLEAFKAGSVRILVATDVAARGLDIPEVKLVINLTFPLTIEDYVHRIGRTGRAGKSGEAITLFTLHDKAHSGELINILKSAGQPVPDELLKFGTTVKKKLHPVYGAFYREVETTNIPAKIVFDD
ncbi:related to ATP-dependent RNA helicase dbp3 [Cephalotrichum gorgonifer]|uniref:RNA helicase n=1 Tax=Cephalotrichum gorgonifer TaxID=2041049 RepID=A0AAE8N6E4_9PEZI|nr:related to ATP-dependent RNA helicase dbp3 [Cephalotrichum gorgonifer]